MAGERRICNIEVYACGFFGGLGAGEIFDDPLQTLPGIEFVGVFEALGRGKSNYLASGERVMRGDPSITVNS